MARERPILMSAPMVRALLDGSKTQTRRIIKPRHDWHVDEVPDRKGVWRQWPVFEAYAYAQPETVEVSCPYGTIGDRLWVRETWGKLTGNGIRTVYRADGELPHVGKMKWGPSIYMLRRDSRITLEITDVRVERLNDISEGDAMAEGIERAGGFMTTGGCWRRYTSDGPSCKGQRESYRSLWESINGPGSWAANPWVWALTFKRVTP